MKDNKISNLSKTIAVYSTNQRHTSAALLYVVRLSDIITGTRTVYDFSIFEVKEYLKEFRGT